MSPWPHSYRAASSGLACLQFLGDVHQDYSDEDKQESGSVLAVISRHSANRGLPGYNGEWLQQST